MKEVKKYLIEFFVIVLGVSVSFLTEQWRQEINDRKEVENLFEKVDNELKQFKEYDSIYQLYEPANVLRKIVFEDSIEANCFLRSLAIIYFSEGDIKNKFPFLYNLSQHKALTFDEFQLVKNLTASVDFLSILLDDNNAKVNALYCIFDKYEIMDDIIKLQEVQLEISKKGEWADWNPSKFGVENYGNYSLLIKDKEARTLLKLIYSNLVDRQLVINEMNENIQKNTQVLKKFSAR